MIIEHKILFSVSAFIVSFVITHISIPSIIRVARLKGLFDEPDERKEHTTNIPTLGGLAIYSGFIISVCLFCDIQDFGEFQFIIASSFIIFLIGIKDDILITAPGTKLLGQIIACLIIIFSDLKITHLHGFFDINEIPFMVSVFITLLVMLVVINGFNLIDGIDGLSSGVGIITSLAFGTWFFLVDQYDYVLLLCSLIGGLIAFFRYNVFSKTNKIFMGDTGSLMVGLIISVALIKFNELNIRKDVPYSIYASPSVSFGILIIPIFDVIRVIFIRFFKYKGLVIFRPDRNHIHHRLVSLGFSHLHSTILIICINFLFICFSFAAAQFFTIRRLLLLIIFFAMLIFYIPDYIFEKRKKSKKEN
jgi:UDP-N-acetylmuramyl pentapeptide phosphotransferase/UDP-N-acetylglucosamine-1-phosphate transferase